MISDRELVRVDQVAALGGLSVRSLQRLFAGYVGEVEDLAGLAVSLGWFDQAHFSRDFRAVVGVPPSAYLQRARRAP